MGCNETLQVLDRRWVLSVLDELSNFLLLDLGDGDQEISEELVFGAEVGVWAQLARILLV